MVFLVFPSHPLGELLDVSAGREMYGPQGGYALLAGHDVTRCLATMSLEPRHGGDRAGKGEPLGTSDTFNFKC